MSATLLKFPDVDIQDIPRGLRNLADAIEAGSWGDAHNVVWVVDCGDGKVELGMLGGTAEPGAVSHLLLGIAMRKLEAL